MTTTQGKKVNPMASCGKSRNLAGHLMRTDTNEKAEVREISGFASDDLEGAFEEINATASGTRARSAAYHAKINPAPSERLTPEQAQRAADILARELKDKKGQSFEGQPRVIVEHIKDGRQHFHVIYSRIDTDRMKAIDPQDNFAAHMRASRQIEKEFGLSVCVDKGGPRQPEPWQMLRAAHADLPDPRAVQKDISDLYSSTKNGAELRAALERKGWVLANGDKNGTYRIVYGPNKSMSEDLRRALYKEMNKQIRKGAIDAKLSDIDRKKLPSTAEAHKQIAEQWKREGREVGGTDYKDARKRLWDEYQQRRQDTRSKAWEQQKKRNKERFAEIRKAQAAKKSIIEQSRAPAAEKRQARAVLRGWVVDQEMQAADAAKREGRVLRMSLQEQATGQDSYKEFLADKVREGDDIALTELRRREALDAKRELKGDGLTVQGAEVWRPEAPRYRPFEKDPGVELVVKGGDVIHRQNGRDLLVDRRDRVDVLQNDNSTIERGLRVAQRKFYGQAITVYGEKAFQEKVARVAAEAGLKIEFDDARLNKIMAERKAEIAAERQKPRDAKTPADGRSQVERPASQTKRDELAAAGEKPRPKQDRSQTERTTSPVKVDEQELRQADRDLLGAASRRATKARGWEQDKRTMPPAMQEAVEALSQKPQAERTKAIEAIPAQTKVAWEKQYREQAKAMGLDKSLDRGGPQR
jgi:hypothetical protein